MGTSGGVQMKLMGWIRVFIGMCLIYPIQEIILWIDTSTNTPDLFVWIILMALSTLLSIFIYKGIDKYVS